MHRTRRTYMQAFFLFFLIVASGAVSAESISIQIDFGNGGTIAPEAWNPVFVRSSDPIPNGTVTLARTSASSGEVVSETYPFPGITNGEFPFFADSDTRRLTVTIKSGEALVASRDYRLSDLTFPGHIITIADADPKIRQRISQILFPWEPVSVGETSVRSLPVLALDYDGVSAIVLREPGPVLSPGQRESLASWIQGGGTLIVTEAKTDTPGVLSQIALEQPVLGRMASTGRNAQDLSTDEWKSLLLLPHHDQSPRLTFSRIFPSDTRTAMEDRNIASPNSTSFMPIFWLAVAVWAALVFIAARLRKRRVVAVVALSFAAIVAVLLLAPTMNGMWQRGSSSILRIAVMPGKSSAFADASVWFSNAKIPGFLAAQVSPYGAHASWRDSEDVFIKPFLGKSLEFTHGSQEPGAVLRIGSSRLARFGATFSGEALDQLVGHMDNPRVQVRNMGGGKLEWQQWNTRLAEWLPSEVVPPLGDSTEWVTRMAQRVPGMTWIIGSSLGQGSPLTVEGSPATEIVWIRPWKWEEVK